MSLYTINEQELSHQPEVCQRYSRKSMLQDEISKFMNELRDAIETGEMLKAQPTTLEIEKQLFRNEKDQETARCRLYRAQDKLEVLIKQEHMSPRQRRRAASAAATEENRLTKNYIRDIFEKAQLDISIGNVRHYPSRGRYNIPHTIRE